MRQTILTAGLGLSFLALQAVALVAAPVVGGYFIDRLPPSSSEKQLDPGKGLILAHVLNTDVKTLKAGTYEVGLEIMGPATKRTLVVKPRSAIAPGSLMTFRLLVPVSAEERKGTFRIFSKINRKTEYSEDYLFTGKSAFPSPVDVKTLYTEAEPEADDVRPPAEIKFEHESAKKTVTRQKPKKKVLPIVVAKTPKAPKPQKTREKVAVARPIDPSSFKTLRTIDEELVIYIIKKGDTLKSIAQQYYQNSAKARVIADLNFIENPASVKVGEEIIVDVRPLKAAKGLTLYKSSPKNALESGSYIVQPGDTLGSIARKIFGNSRKASAILKANPGINARNLKIGASIALPKGGNV